MHFELLAILSVFDDVLDTVLNEVLSQPFLGLMLLDLLFEDNLSKLKRALLVFSEIISDIASVVREAPTIIELVVELS